MKKLMSALISAAFIATPMVVISAPAAAQSVMLMIIVGLGLSVPIVLGTSKFFESFLFDMKPNDPVRSRILSFRI